MAVCLRLRALCGRAFPSRQAAQKNSPFISAVLAAMTVIVLSAPQAAMAQATYTYSGPSLALENPTNIFSLQCDQTVTTTATVSVGANGQVISGQISGGGFSASIFSTLNIQPVFILSPGPPANTHVSAGGVLHASVVGSIYGLPVSPPDVLVQISTIYDSGFYLPPFSGAPSGTEATIIKKYLKINDTYF